MGICIRKVYLYLCIYAFLLTYTYMNPFLLFPFPVPRWNIFKESYFGSYSSSVRALVHGCHKFQNEED